MARQGVQMFGRRITLFKMLGFEVKVDASWLIIAVLIVWSLAIGIFPNQLPGLPAATYWWMGIFGALGLFGSIVVHELSHSIVARRNGLAMKGITLFVFGGVAEMEGEPQNPKTEFLMAIAGPLASAAIGFVFYAIGLAAATAWPVEVLAVVNYLASINWLLAAFNLIPAFPLDGGRVLRAALWQRTGNLVRATRIAAFAGSIFGALLIAGGIFQLFSGYFVGAVWWFLLGMFLRGISTASYQRVLMQSVLEGEPVRRFMNPNPVTVKPDISVQELVDDYIYKYHHKMFPVVTDSQQLVGCVSTEQVKELPRSEWSRHSLQEIAKACSPQNTISPDTDAAKVLSIMSRAGDRGLIVVDNNRVVAFVSHQDLLHFLSTKLELEGRDGKVAAKNVAVDAGKAA
jgi:Zn-dependent protease/predicted transcriptional regulator